LGLSWLGVQEDFGEDVLLAVLGRFGRAHPRVGMGVELKDRRDCDHHSR
jgi:hypothetical protein